MIPTVLASLAVACSGGSDDADTSEAAVTELTAYWADAKRLDLGDLTRVSVGFATSEVNAQLSSGAFVAKIEPPAVYAASAERSRVLPSGASIKALDAIVTGLASQFGEHELGTEVNALRLDHLKSGADAYYVESAFSAKAGLPHAWSFDAAGLPTAATVTLGFDAGAEIASRIIVAADDDKLGSLLEAPLKALADTRGFVYPRSLDEIRGMKPGEMFALRGLGKLGANFGVGAPLLVADPTGGAAYRIVASGGVSTVVGGQIDVQLVRLSGDEVAVDVGVQDGTAMAVAASIHDGAGIKGICEDGLPCLRTVDLGAAKVDLARLLEKAVEKRLGAYLTFKIEAGASRTSTRVSVSRLRFHLDRGDPAEVSRALEQALKFDIRLAQALYNRDLGEASPAVTVDFDAVRAATTSTRNFGFELLGMNIYDHAVVDKQGTFVVQTPDGVQEVLFDSVNKHGGWFQMEHGYSRSGVAAQMLDAKSPDAFRSEANLFFQVNVGDSHMDDDLLIDNVDGLLSGIVGHEAVEALDAYGNELERTVWSRCPVKEDTQHQTKTWDEACNVALLDDPVMADLKAKGMDAIEPFARKLPDDYARLVREAANVRLTLQSVGIHNLDAFNGPNASFALDVRLDDRALTALTSKGRDAYRSALREYLTAVYADRRKVGRDLDKDAVRKSVDDKWGQQMDKMADAFETQAKGYRLIADAERLLPSTLAGKHYALFPLGVRFNVDRDDAKTYGSAVLTSLSHDRALAAAALFDGLLKRAHDINAPLYMEHTAAYPLLALVPSDSLEVGMDVRADVRSNFWVSRQRFLKAGFKSVAVGATGANVSVLGAGLFDLKAVIGAP